MGSSFMEYDPTEYDILCFFKFIGIHYKVIGEFINRMLFNSSEAHLILVR
jgi:hypothetical protein